MDTESRSCLHCASTLEQSVSVHLKGMGDMVNVAWFISDPQSNEDSSRLAPAVSHQSSPVHTGKIEDYILGHTLECHQPGGSNATSPGGSNATNPGAPMPPARGGGGGGGLQCHQPGGSNATSPGAPMPPGPGAPMPPAGGAPMPPAQGLQRPEGPRYTVVSGPHMELQPLRMAARALQKAPNTRGSGRNLA